MYIIYTRISMPNLHHSYANAIVFLFISFRFFTFCCFIYIFAFKFYLLLHAISFVFFLFFVPSATTWCCTTRLSASTLVGWSVCFYGNMHTCGVPCTFYLCTYLCTYYIFDRMFAEQVWSILMGAGI